ncbi:Regulator of RNase E activity RraA [Bosea sp. OK403]|uniref:RraA family protein n=1 Tax=Bosea sp. OK403 TaxID=1855286 RepID=UPI0008E94EB7|nr:RraA family protein [Bosea sp. OK403]SFJ15546.1 Regulator of RNase E activity RraA [Bosea sp. OK403]
MNFADRLDACHSSVVHDVMKDLGLPLRVLPRTIIGLEPWMRCAGPVFTVRGRPDPTLDKHNSLLEWATLLSRVPQGRVVIVQPQDDRRALFGGLSAEALKIKGARGYIADGGCRDIDAIAKERFPVFARYATPIDIVSAWRVESYEEPIAVGNEMVQPDDYVLADRDGIILVPGAAVEAVVAAAEQKMETEGEMVKAIRAGVDPLEAYLKHRVF